MIYREEAFNEADAFVQKAKTLYSADVQNAPLEPLDTLVIINEALLDAEKVYKKKQITNWQHPDLAELTQSVGSHYPDIQQHAVDLMLELVKRTRLLRTQIEEVKTRPAMAAERSTEEMVKFLSDRYNKEITDCCLRHLGNIDHLLMVDTNQYRDMLIQIRSINSDLYKMIKEADYGEALRNEIQSLQTNL